MSAKDMANRTRTAWENFSSLSDDQLDSLLNAAGVVPMKDRAMKLHQTLVVWFHGLVPNLLEIENLSRETAEGKHRAA